MVVATTVSLLVYALPKEDTSPGKSKLGELELLRTVDGPTLPGKDVTSSFRAARYVIGPTLCHCLIAL